MSLAVETDPRCSPAIKKLVCFLYRFPLPATKIMSFKKCLSNELGYEDTLKAIEHMDQAREDIAIELAAGNPNYTNIIAGTQRYIPLITQILYSFEKSPPVSLSVSLMFDWTTGIGINPRLNFIRSPVVIWDKCMSIVSQGLAHANAFHSMVRVVEGNADTLFMNAASELKKAAGTFLHAANVELPKWIVETTQKEVFPETSSSVCEGLATFCLAEAQQMAIAKALTKDKATPNSLLAKLCVGVAKLMDTSDTIFRNKGQKDYSKIGMPFLAHISLQSSLHRAMADSFLAADAWIKSQYGLAIAHQKRAIVIFNKLPVPYNTSINFDLQNVRVESLSILESYEKDNSSIYFETIPEPNPLPDGLIMFKPEPYILDEPVFLKFGTPPLNSKNEAEPGKDLEGGK
mmetsp:Transcript_12297/g.18421  ORF Transcript_12297/g.18421 Transcript_12297/m.18421 type:complete len:403 (+) Transcript_12297:32-1240(+)